MDERIQKEKRWWTTNKSWGPPTFRVQIEEHGPAKEKGRRKNGETQDIRREKCPPKLVLSVTDLDKSDFTGRLVREGKSERAKEWMGGEKKWGQLFQRLQKVTEQREDRSELTSFPFKV